MVTAITTAFLSTVSAIFSGIGTSLIDIFETVVVDVDPGVDTILHTADDVVTLTNLGTWMIIFMGVSFALTIFYAILRKVL